MLLKVQDDGVGLPKVFSIGSTDGLGLVLVEMLAQQVGGSFSVSSEAPGTCFLVRFPLSIRDNSA